MEPQLLVVVALGWENVAIARQIKAFSIANQGSAKLLRGRPPHGRVSILQTGMGPQRARAAIAWAAEIVRPATVLSTGCAGSLSVDLAAGDVVIANEVLDAGGSARATSPRWRDRYEQAAVNAKLRPWRGRMLTTSEIQAGSLEKRRLGERTLALAVDMEGAAIAEWASVAGVEFAAARVILDPLEMAVSREIAAATTEDGGISAPRILSAVARKPGLVRELAALGAAAAKCRRALAAVHRELLQRLDL